MVSLRCELLRESLSGIDLLYLISIESLRIGKCDECGESEKYQENGYSEEREEKIFR